MMQAQVMVKEIRIWVLLLLISMICLGLGSFVGNQAGKITSWQGRDASEWLKFEVIPSLLVFQLPIKEPWEIRPADLDGKRIVYNILTKPGLRWLVFQVVLCLFVMIGTLYSLSSIYRNRYKEITGHEPRGVLPPLIEVSGSIAVHKGRGVIYKLSEKFSELAFRVGF